MQRRLLIADDNASLSRFVATVAERNGWVCSVHAGGADLIATVDGLSEGALIFLDILMPDMDGIEVVKELVRLPNRNALRLRFLTGAVHHDVAAAQMIAAGRSLNIGPTIHKPVRMQELETILREEADLIERGLP